MAYNDPGDEDDYNEDDEYDRAQESIYQVLRKFKKAHPGSNPSISLDEMPNCCSGLVLSGAYIGGRNKDIPQEELVALVNDMIKAAGKGYSWLISTLLMGSQHDWAKVLVAAGFEESVQVSKSNDYNGPQPLKVFIKALRPMTKQEVEKGLEHYKEESAKAKKGGYEW